MDQVCKFASQQSDLMEEESKFTTTHAAAHQSWLELTSPTQAERDEHMIQAVSGMITLSVSVAKYVHKLSCSGSEWVNLQDNAEAMYAAVQVLASSLLVDENQRRRIQDVQLEYGVVALVNQLLAIPKAIELRFYAEGYRTDIVNLMANLSFENEAVARAVLHEEGLLPRVMEGTRIDEDNPGQAEWAEFALRNLCKDKDVSDYIRELAPLRVDDDSQKVLQRSQLSASFSAEGKVTVASSSKSSANERTKSPVE
jgi:hypothetical protein